MKEIEFLINWDKMQNKLETNLDAVAEAVCESGLSTSFVPTRRTSANQPAENDAAQATNLKATIIMAVASPRSAAKPEATTSPTAT